MSRAPALVEPLGRSDTPEFEALLDEACEQLSGPLATAVLTEAMLAIERELRAVGLVLSEPATVGESDRGPNAVSRVAQGNVAAVPGCCAPFAVAASMGVMRLSTGFLLVFVFEARDMANVRIALGELVRTPLTEADSAEHFLTNRLAAALQALHGPGGEGRLPALATAFCVQLADRLAP